MMSDVDAVRVRRSFRAFVVSLLLAAIGVAPWVANTYLPPPGDEGEHQRLAWAWLFYISGVPLLIIAGVFNVTSFVYGCMAIWRRPVVVWWLVASVVVLAAWSYFAIEVLY
jgi:hypothetical protein